MSSLQSRFLVTDLLVMSQTLLLTLMPLEQRLSTLEAEIIQPLKLMLASPAAAAAAPIPHPLLHIRAKPHSPLAKIDSVLHMKVPHVHEGITVRMSGKDKDAAKSAGYQFVWRKVSCKRKQHPPTRPHLRPSKWLLDAHLSSCHACFVWRACTQATPGDVSASDLLQLAAAKR